MSAASIARAMPRAVQSSQQQRGVVMWVALGVLIVMSLTGLAMMRQMGGGLSIAGNVSFKQSATSLADLGTEKARDWITNNGNKLASTNAAVGYHATWGTSIDPTTWTADWAAVTPAVDDTTGNSVKWIVHRLCELEGVDANGALQHCSSVGARAPGRGVPGAVFNTVQAPYFRITTQVSGPRNTVSYVQVLAD